VASGKAAEFARLDLVEAFSYVEEGSRRGLVLSEEAKSGRIEDVKVFFFFIALEPGVQ